MDILSIVDRVTEPAFLVDRTHRITAWNEACEKLAGCAAASVLGKGCSQVIRGTDVFGNRFCGANCPVLNMVRHDERVNSFELNLPTAKAETTRINVSIIVLRRADAEFAVLHHLNLSGLENRQLPRLETATSGAGKPQRHAVEQFSRLTHKIRNSGNP